MVETRSECMQYRKHLHSKKQNRTKLPIESRGVYFPTFTVPSNSAIHIGKYTVRPMHPIKLLLAFVHVYGQIIATSPKKVAKEGTPPYLREIYIGC